MLQHFLFEIDVADLLDLVLLVLFLLLLLLQLFFLLLFLLLQVALSHEHHFVTDIHQVVLPLYLVFPGRFVVFLPLIDDLLHPSNIL